MATNITSSTFSSTYRDDFRDSDNYHRILFNGGRVVQPRELTQLQTIIQRELTRLGNYFFKEGAILNASGASLASRNTAIDYIILATTPGYFEDLEGKIITRASSTVKARVKKILTTAEATALTSTAVTPGPTLLIEYLDGSGSATSSLFAAGNTFTIADWAGGGVALAIRNTGNDVGKGSIIEMPQLNLYAAGRFVFVEAQSVVIDPYSTTPTEIIGYKVTEDIVTVQDTVTLYDNTGSTPNLSSPGADRYRIKLTLARKSDMTTSDTFIDLIEVRNGVQTAIVTQDNQLDQLGNLLATRTKDITGDFIVKNLNGTFACEIGDDSDTDFYQINITPGVAFVGGYRIEKNTYTTIRLEKPRDAVNDISTITNEVVPFTLGNYFLVDSLGGGFINNIGAASPYIALLDSVNDSAGFAAIIHAEKVFDEAEGNFDYKVYVNDITMDSTGTPSVPTGVLRDLRSVRKLGMPGNANMIAEIKKIDGGYGLQDRRTNTLLTPLYDYRVKSLTSISADVAKVSSLLTANVSGQITIVDPDGETLTNPEDWFWVNTTTLKTGQVTSTSAMSTSVTISGLTNGQSYYVYYYARRTYGSFGATYTNVSTGPHTVTNGAISFTTGTNQYHVAKINSVTDVTNNEDVKYKFALESGQKDDRYQPPILRLKPGYSQPNNVQVDFDYFNGTVASGNVRVSQSYSVDHEFVPTYRNSFGTVYNLSDVIDFRPTKNGSNAYSGYPGLPKNNSLIEINTAVYWQPRIDRVFLTKDGQFRVAIGSTDATAQSPEVPPDALLLGDIYINPYMKSKKDHRFVRVDNSGYKMSDLRALEKRISNLEEITTLTMSELAIKDLSVQDEDGNDRYKLGLTVDKFDLNSQTDMFNPEQRAMLDKQAGAVRPYTVIRDMVLVYDSANSYKTRRYGPVIWPEFTEVSYLSQTSVSEAINVNQFSLSRYFGSGVISPATDTWTRSVRVTDVEGDTEVNRILSQGNQRESIDPYWKRLGYASYQAFVADRLTK